MNPLLAREVRSRWRDGRAFGLVFFFAGGLSLLLALLYGSKANPSGFNTTPGQWATLGQSLFSYFAWIQTLAWLLIAPALTSSAIAYERERGWFDSLILSPLRPRQIALGKWAGALLYTAILYGVTLPCIILVLLMGGVSPGQLALVMALHILCACCGAAIGLATSAWSYRSHVALRSAYGLLLIWLFSSFGGALWSGRTAYSRLVAAWGGSAPSFWEWLGRTNPILCANEISSGSPLQNWPLCFSLLALTTLFFLWVATYYASRPLEEAPYVEPRRRKKNAPPLQSHGEIPLVTRLKFHNPVLDHEVRSKFRMRQPPLAVIVVEALLGVLVAGFYLRTFYWALFEPKYRTTIWAGLIITGMIVTMMSAAVMGANGFSREREKGTWESLRLSLLEPGEIIRGKIFASLWTCLLFSLPVWPLLLPCISWGYRWFEISRPGTVLLLNAVSCALIWLGTIWSYTFVGLWIGRAQTRSSRAAGQALGLLGTFVILGPIFMLSLGNDGLMVPLLASLHPLVAIIIALKPERTHSLFIESGVAYFAFHLIFGSVLWIHLTRAIGRDMNQGSRTNQLPESDAPK